jgi:6-phosphofructokinase 1
MGIDGLVAAGGDDTLGNALFLKEHGFPVIGIPKTMDLDLKNTDYSVGFWSYVESARVSAIDYIETLKSHGRVGVIEVFGRDSGFTAAALGITADSCYIATPEIGININDLKNNVLNAYQANRWALVVVSEAISFDEDSEHEIGIDGHINLSDREAGKHLAKVIQDMTGFETKATQMDHPYRGRIIAYDAFIGFRLGLKAAEMVCNQHWGSMIGIDGEKLVAIPLESFLGTRKIESDSYWYDLVVGRNTGQV